MYFLGWHGTAHSNAHGLLKYGIRAEKTRVGQLGLGFYIAKFDLLPSAWADHQVIDPHAEDVETPPHEEYLPHHQESVYTANINVFRKAFAHLTGVSPLQLSQITAHEMHLSIACLKVYAMEPISVRWEGMHPPDDVMRQLVQEGEQAPDERYHTSFRLACIPLEQIKHLRVAIDDGEFEELYDGRVDRARRVKPMARGTLSPPGRG